MKYCAFLRGVNVKGTNMKMSDVCQVFKDAGVTDVTSVLASGNIVFSSDKAPASLKQLLEDSMSAYFSYEAFLFIRSQEEVELLQANIPFEIHTDFHVYAFVGTTGVETILMDEFSNCRYGLLLARTQGQYLGFQLRKGVGEKESER